MKPIRKKLTYEETREKVHKILNEFFDWEYECSKGKEFDIEWLEFKTDDILRLIINQGGSYAE